MTPVRWALAALAVIAVCVVIGVTIAARLDILGIALMVVIALAATYFAGRLDKRRDEAEQDTPQEAARD